MKQNLVLCLGHNVNLEDLRALSDLGNGEGRLQVSPLSFRWYILRQPMRMSGT